MEMLRTFSSLSLVCSALRPTSVGSGRQMGHEWYNSCPSSCLHQRGRNDKVFLPFFSPANWFLSSHPLSSGTLVVCIWMNGLPLMWTLPSGNFMIFLVALVMKQTTRFFAFFFFWSLTLSKMAQMTFTGFARHN